MIPIIGGKLDGQHAHGKILQIEEKGESYMLIEFTWDKRKHWLYVLCNGPSPEEAIKTYKQRNPA